MLRRVFRRLRFSLRTLLVLVTLLCVGLGWYVSRVRPQKAAVAKLRAHGIKVGYEFQRDELGRYFVDGYDGSAVPKWILQLLGRDFFYPVSYAYCGKDAT